MFTPRLLLFIFGSIIIYGCGLSITGPSDFSSGEIKYYGYYFVEDPSEKLADINEVGSFINIINVRYDNGINNSWDPAAAARILSSGSKVMLQIPFGNERDQTLFTDQIVRKQYLDKIRQDMIDTNFMSSIAYIAVFEEWYVLTSHGYFDAWPIFQGRGTYEKMEIAKKYLELIIDDVNRAFPGIPTVIVENILHSPPPPNNLDIIGIDAYYIPTSPDCDLEQKAIFNAQVMPYYDIGRNYGKPIMMVAPSFVGGPWKMLSECQMQWYADLALNNSYNIESFIWFFYGDVAGMTGVRNYPNLVAYQRNISCQLLGRRYC